MPSPSVLLFDAAGTLLETAEPVGQTYARFARRHGLHLDAEALQRGFKAAFTKLGPRKPGTVPHHGDDRPWWREVVRLSLGPQPLPADFPFDLWFEELYVHFARPEAWRPFPEVKSVLGSLHERRYRLAVLSNWDSRLHPVLDGLGLGAFFEKVFVSAEIGWAKPSPEIFLHALSAMRCPPREAMMIGDTPADDILPAEALGLASYAAERPRTDLQGLLPILSE